MSFHSTRVSLKVFSILFKILFSVPCKGFPLKKAIINYHIRFKLSFLLVVKEPISTFDFLTLSTQHSTTVFPVVDNHVLLKILLCGNSIQDELLQHISCCCVDKHSLYNIGTREKSDADANIFFCNPRSELPSPLL